MGRMTLRGYSPLALLAALLLVAGLAGALAAPYAGGWPLAAAGATLVLGSVTAAVLSVLDG